MFILLAFSKYKQPVQSSGILWLQRQYFELGLACPFFRWSVSGNRGIGCCTLHHFLMSRDTELLRSQRKNRDVEFQIFDVRWTRYFCGLPSHVNWRMSLNSDREVLCFAVAGAGRFARIEGGVRRIQHGPNVLTLLSLYRIGDIAKRACVRYPWVSRLKDHRRPSISENSWSAGLARKIAAQCVVHC